MSGLCQCLLHITTLHTCHQWVILSLYSNIVTSYLITFKIHYGKQVYQISTFHIEKFWCFMKRTGKMGKLLNFLLWIYPIYYMEFHRCKLRSTATLFTVSQTCKVPIIYRELVNCHLTLLQTELILTTPTWLTSSATCIFEFHSINASWFIL